MKPLSFREVKRKLLRLDLLWLIKPAATLNSLKLRMKELARATVPHHREVASGTLRSILRQAGLSEKEFRNL